MSDRNEVCWACNVVTPDCDLEWHHFIPKIDGGKSGKIHTDLDPTTLDDRHNTIPLCTRCHSLADRVRYETWLLWAMSEENKFPAPPWAKLTMLKQWSMIFRLMRTESAST